MDLDEQMKDVPEDGIDDDILQASTADVVTRRHLLENDIKVMKLEHQRLLNEKNSLTERIRDNVEKIENNRYVYFLLSLQLERSYQTSRAQTTFLSF